VDGNASSTPFADLIVIGNLDSPDTNNTFGKELSEANSTTWQANVSTDYTPRKESEQDCSKRKVSSNSDSRSRKKHSIINSQ